MGSLVVRDRAGNVLDDIFTVAFDKSAKRRLSRMGECSFRIPSYLASEVQADGFPLICKGRRQVALTLDSAGLFHHGIVWILEDEGDEDMCYTRVTSYDPMIVWRYRPARDGVASGDAGDFSDPNFIARNMTGPQIMQEILEQSEDLAGQGADDAEGQLFLDLATSTYAVGGADLRGAPTNWPMSIADIATLLTNTGELDIVIEPIIGGVGAEGFQNMGRVHCFNGDHGTDLTASVHFDYLTGHRNVRLYKRSGSMDEIGNKLWYFLGPRLDQQHWRANVTADHPGLVNPPGGKVEPSPVGPLGTAISDSRDDFGVFMLISIYDNFGSESSAYPLFLRQWQVESLLRLAGREMHYVTPVRTSGGTAPAGMDVYQPGDFDIGDLVTINTGAESREAQSGAQRIYGYTVTIDNDDVEELGEFEASPDQDAI